ncbi:hypothetical protein NQZ68_035552 [Dissostichus eleginoides]|nr:hypothetical protein NQZ68_035552 [Dissostichus eleginoides]
MPYYVDDDESHFVPRKITRGVNKGCLSKNKEKPFHLETLQQLLRLFLLCDHNAWTMMMKLQTRDVDGKLPAKS